MSLLYALLDRKSKIELCHLDAALAVWKYCEASTRFIFGESLGDETADELLEFLKVAGSAGATRTEISKLFKGHKPSPEISRALATLGRKALVRCQTEASEGARNIERWFYMPKKDSRG